MSQSRRKEAVGKLRLPHPYLTTYDIISSDRKTSDGAELLQLERVQSAEELKQIGDTPEFILKASSLHFTLAKGDSDESLPPLSDNTPWARARRAPLSQLAWEVSSAPLAGEIWLVLYAIFTLQPEVEVLRVRLVGPGNGDVKSSLKASMLAIEHPSPDAKPEEVCDELMILRSAFWQGAGSPFGASPPWAPSSGLIRAIEPVVYSLTTKFPNSRVHIRHPHRNPKPAPGSLVYSRYIASLDAMFSLIALDYKNDEHLQLFHKWQNDPRVAAGWNETGTLEEHRQYLKKQHDDPHTLTVLGRFDDAIFSYFEIFWAKEDHVGAHYEAGDFDRGRHTIVGDDRFRGRALAWWPCIIHYCFLDDSRTSWVVGEPIATNNTVMVYDYTFGLNVEKVIDFPHKRAALVKVSRERFFQLCPLHQQGGYIAGTGVPLPSKI